MALSFVIALLFSVIVNKGTGLNETRGPLISDVWLPQAKSMEYFDEPAVHKSDAI